MSLGRNPFGPDVIDLMLRYECRDPSLKDPEKTFDLSFDDLAVGDEGVARLIARPELARCRNLSLMENRITARGARLLAQCPAAAGLEELELGNNAIEDAGALALASSPFLAGLRNLSVGYCRLTDAGVEALVDSPHLVGLRVFTVFGPPLADAVAALLIRAPWPDLEKLYVGRFGPAAEQAFLDRFGEKVVFC